MSIFLNERLLTFDQYPNGETIVPDLHFNTDGNVRVRLHWESDVDLVRLVLIKGLIDQIRYSDAAFYRVQTVLTIDYFPYSRMDREQDGKCFSLKYIADMLNEMNWDKVHIVEPHSQVTLDLVRRSSPVWATAKLTPKAMDMMGFNLHADYIVLPDKGAYKRYADLMPETLNICNVVVMGKDRDFATGKIKGMKIEYKIVRHDGPVRRALIIDDLSSRGGTFVGAADVLRAAGFEYVALLVTHMEPAGLLGDLRHKLDRVYCTDTMTFPRPVPDNFEIFQRSDWL